MIPGTRKNLKQVMVDRDAKEAVDRMFQLRQAGFNYDDSIHQLKIQAAFEGFVLDQAEWEQLLQEGDV